MDERRQPPPRTQPILPLWFGPVAVAAVGTVVTVLLGGALAGLLTGAGAVTPGGFYGILRVVRGLVTSPGDPGAGWPEDARPGSAAMTWTCLVVVAIVYMAAVAAVSSKLSRRRTAKRRRAQGFADRSELSKRGLDHKQAVRKAQTNRSSLAGTSSRKLAAHEVATRVGSLYGEQGKDAEVFIQYRDGVMVEGPTGSGKSWRLAWHRIVESPGFVVATTTKPDLLWSSVAQRLSAGPVMVFDPEQITKWPFPMRWSILAGCDDPETAMRRAAALAGAMPMQGTSNADYFEGKAATLMRCYLYAAAVSGEDLRTLRRWVSLREVPQVQQILDRELPDWGAEYAQMTGSGSDSQDDVIATAIRLLEPLASPRLMEAVNVPIAESADLESLIRAGGTMYLISKGTKQSVAPFVSVVANELHYLAERIALQAPEERIDPPMRMVLDEVNNVAPIPELPDKITDSGGRGISIWVFSHGQKQNIKRWGPNVGEMFTTNSPVRIILPGLGDMRELEEISKLTGSREEWFAPHQAPRQMPVMSGSEVRQMAEDQALMIYRGANPALLHLPTVWEVPHLKERVLESQAVYEWVCETGELPDWAWAKTPVGEASA
ncbi:TraM recognition domain-containing protein (plasmid) [Prescottella equi]|uniref:type IV secretory system conjugative DNA transfer family protein n=1 Tax=Rhodococcus hoagii TaxID=43767 RepID=UPI002575F07A|nr:TraM recognition domain-containing protein [Prescottella equi]WJJ14707.1 TraM recognition domain-containing protein [Prescottella equi]